MFLYFYNSWEYKFELYNRFNKVREVTNKSAKVKKDLNA